MSEPKKLTGVVRGVRVKTPVKPRAKGLLLMSPYALQAYAYRWYMLGFQDTGKGFNGETVPVDNKMIRSLLGVRFERLHRTKSDHEEE